MNDEYSRPIMDSEYDVEVQEVYYGYDKEFDAFSQNIASLENKLYKIKENFGCPAEVIYKALTNGVYSYVHFKRYTYSNRKGYMAFCNNVTLSFKDNDFILTFYNKNGQQVFVAKLKDYKKTWWLRKDMYE